VKALCWEGVNKLSVERVPDPRIENEQDAIVKVLASTTCGSDLHLVGGYVPAMRAGDVIGASSQFAAFEGPRPHARCLLMLEVAVVIQAPGNPQPQRPVAPPWLHGERVGR
jgi:threonine dehydrogenase-like Zn-dependent dehydrogenase